MMMTILTLQEYYNQILNNAAKFHLCFERTLQGFCNISETFLTAL